MEYLAHHCFGQQVKFPVISFQNVQQIPSFTCLKYKTRSLYSVQPKLEQITQILENNPTKGLD